MNKKPRDESLRVTCECCGAPMPLLSGNNAKCVYCGNSQPLPPHVRDAMARESAMNEYIEETLQEMEENLHKSSNVQMIFVGVLLLFVVGVAALMIAIQYHNLGLASGESIDPARKLMFMIVTVMMLPGIIIPVAWMVVLNRSKKLRFATLPMTVSYLEKGHLVADCSACGARLRPGDHSDVATKCSHCATESLLPLPLIHAHFQKKHHHIMKHRMNTYGPTADAIQDATTTWQRYAVPIIITFSLLLGFSLIGLVMYINLRS